jgi:hypothetical protein
VKRKRLFGSSDWGGTGICTNKRGTKGGYRSFVALYSTGTKSQYLYQVPGTVMYVPVYRTEQSFT